MKMKLLFLPGVNCTNEIWNMFNGYVRDWNIDYAVYPHDVTSAASKPEDLTEWVYKTYGNEDYDAVIGHSLGGIIALQLAASGKMNFRKIIYLDTNLKPANEFYRNLMTQEHMQKYGEQVCNMLTEERKFYSQAFLDKLKEDFDYTPLVKMLNQKVYAIYGDRNQPEYNGKISDLNLSDEIISRLDIRFIKNACHMIMLENPLDLYEMLTDILNIKTVEAIPQNSK